MPLSESDTDHRPRAADGSAEPRLAAADRAPSDRVAVGEPDRQSPERADEENTGHDRPAGDRTPPGSEGTLLAQSYLTFHAPVYAQGGEFGSALTAAVGRRRITGRLDDRDVRAALDFYVPSAEYATALAALLKNHVVVLEGREGVGRRATAIALLREVTDGRIVVLPPVLTLVDHAERTYERGFAYLTIDRIPEPAAHGGDVEWRAVRDRIRDAGAYLIITAGERAVRTTSEVVGHVRLSRPALETVLRAHLPELSELDLGQLAEVIPHDWTMAGVADVGRRVRAGESIECVLDVFDSAAASQVGSWFDRGLTHRELAEVTVLCFAVGQSRRSFERLVERLDSHFARGRPSLDDPSPRDRPVGGVPEIRAAFTDPGGLIAVRARETGGDARYAVAFGSAGYRRRVVAELSRRHDSRFWDAVRSWLEEVLDECDPREVAVGLADLARTDTDEVEHEYLERWAAGAIGPRGQLTAAFTLWAMCFEDTLARFALRRAILWINEPDSERRRTALRAFSGDLGLCYPAEAVRRIWQLITQDPRLSAQAQNDMANLFAALTHTGEDAAVVLRKLGRHLDQFVRRGADVRLRELTMSTTLAVLTHWDPIDRRPTISSYLSSHPDQSSLAAALWRGVLRHRGYRKSGMETLLATLAALERTGTGTGIAAGLGAVLRRDLTAAELQAFRSDLMGLLGDPHDARTRLVRVLAGTETM
ncbi:hypothetical protein [Parafrankia sp. EUN1f]|uniref:hypothetical protein n=1 Tax=Parafrankia sp. EUN1f TaxID=102897 RepID=UPI0001C474C5|nr:hypothetical protein [Parafrankia sp. EUN1f]EFC79779.1 hypothetical protein FrEUN1fDRAFT_7108 [Parafrankia sp. EUN1f]